MSAKFLKISTDKAPSAVGPYVQGLEPVNPGKPVFLSGQIPINPKTGKIDADDIETQTRQVLDNIEAVLAEAQLKLEDIIHMRVYLENMGDFATFNSIYAERFGDHKPTRETIQVAKLPLGAKIEMVPLAWRESL